ncbi:uncharacterized protein DS421_18g614650 [Arachis hypogaea]|nr:uncharacterized protein DS421_18g614650 [Arachis hypogaea]
MYSHYSLGSHLLLTLSLNPILSTLCFSLLFTAPQSSVIAAFFGPTVLILAAFSSSTIYCCFCFYFLFFASLQLTFTFVHVAIEICLLDQ